MTRASGLRRILGIARIRTDLLRTDLLRTDLARGKAHGLPTLQARGRESMECASDRAGKALDQQRIGQQEPNGPATQIPACR